MSKVSGSYKSVTLGVSQQVKQERFEGQYTEQVNFISDPVKGLCRRQGSVYENSLKFNNYNPLFLEDTIKDTNSFRSYDFFVDRSEYTLLYRSATKVGNSQAPFCFCWNKETKEFMTVVTDSNASPFTQGLLDDGVSSLVASANFLFIAGNKTSPHYSNTNLYSQYSNLMKGVVWIRTGAYNRTYSIRLKISDGTTTNEINVEYTTMSANYPGYLDTSDLTPVDNPNYQQEVNERTSEYNQLLTQWITDSGADVLTANIASKLKGLLDAEITAQYLDGFIETSIDKSTIGVKNKSGDTRYIISLVADDLGDETLIRGVANVVQSTAQLSAEHFAGKIVKVSPYSDNQGSMVSNDNDKYSYYVKAVSKSNAGSDILSEVQWIEASAENVNINNIFGIATVNNNTLYIASSPQNLQGISGRTVPTFPKKNAGDFTSEPMPLFYDSYIDYLGVFQDRLIIGTGPLLYLSKPGDYFNFYRTSMLTITDSDTIGISSLSSLADTIKYSSMFDKNLVLFGKINQYIISGQSVLTPSSALIQNVSAYEDTTYSQPKQSGNFVFFNKYKNGFASLHQFQVGLTANTPMAYDISQQIPKYIKGHPIEIIPLTSPNNIMIRADGERNTLYNYYYLDDSSSASRQQDAFYKIQWDASLGYHMGMTYRDGSISVFTVRFGLDKNGDSKWFAVSDAFTYDTSISVNPNFDSIVKYSQYIDVNYDGPLNSNTIDDTYSVAFDSSSNYFLLGQTATKLDELIEQYPDDLNSICIGKNMEAYAIPTNPYVKDRNNKSILGGKLSMTKYTLNLVDSGGFICSTIINGNEKIVADFSGRTIAKTTATLNKFELSTRPVSALIGKTTDKFDYKISSRKWMPLCISSIEWVGQWFYNVQRF